MTHCSQVPVLVAMIVLQSWICSAAAADFEQLRRDDAVRAGEALIAAIRASEPRAAAFEMDPSQSVALRSADGAAQILLLPAAKLLPDLENPFLAQEHGLPVGWIAFQGLNLANVPTDKLFVVKLSNSADPRPMAALLTVRRISSAEFRMELWGKADAPLAAVPMFSRKGPNPGVVSLAVRTGLLDMCWLGKYRAYLTMDRSVVK